MATLTIAPIEGLSLKAAASLFVGAFGSLWLMLEPLGYFGILPAASRSMGMLIYIGMVAFAILAVLLSARVHQLVALSKLTFVTFTVVSATEGAEYHVRAPTHMQVRDFTFRFLKHLRKGLAGENIEWLNRYFDPVFQIESDGNVIDVDGDQTLVQAGIVDGVRCQIRGKPKEHRVLFSAQLE